MDIDFIDKFLKRSDTIQGWKCIDVIDFDYWDVRYKLPKKITDPKGFVSYICEKYGGGIDFEKLTTNEILEFYFWVKDELIKIGATERVWLTPKKLSAKTNTIPSPDLKDFLGLMELLRLSDFCPIKKEQIKKEKYSSVFEVLLGLRIEGDKVYKDLK